MKPESKSAKPERWVDLDASAPDACIGELFRAVAEPEPLSSRSLARVHERLALARPTNLARRRFRELSMAGVMLLAGSSFALAALGAADWWGKRRALPSLPAEHATSSASATEPSKRRPAAPQRAPEGAPLVEAPNVVETPAAPSSVAPRSSASSQTASDATGLAAETEVLERVLLKLRRERDARGALALLDESQALLARGSLALEAQVARVDALLALNRKSEALALLERLPLAQVGRGGELRLVRAELRAAGDCGRALSDFDLLVRQTLAAPLAERALYGRAACELEVGDRQQAERDLGQYLARFPQGRFAAEVRSRLARLKGP